MSRSTDGAAVAEVDLDAVDMSEPEVLAEARRHGAAVVWAYSSQPPSTPGFVSRPGYVRLRAEAPVTGPPLPRVAPDEYGSLLAQAFRGLWGHKWIDESAHLPNDDSVVICLAEAGRPVGLCRMWPRTRLADQPGVVPAHRGTARAVALLAAGCSEMGPGPVDVDTWGESPDVIDAFCEQLRFEVVERRPGWELSLRTTAQNL